jgi:hypothetical protein
MKKTGNKMCEAFATSIELGDLNIMGQANTELINFQFYLEGIVKLEHQILSSDILYNVWCHNFSSF